LPVMSALYNLSTFLTNSANRRNSDLIDKLDLIIICNILRRLRRLHYLIAVDRISTTDIEITALFNEIVKVLALISFNWLRRVLIENYIIIIFIG
jgi:hypothetical protein